MTLSRDLTLQNLDLLYGSSIANQYARYALAIKYEMFPEKVVHAAKRCLLDTLGCAIGAYNAPGYPMVEKMVRETGGNGEATVFRTGLRTTAGNATLANSFLVRFLDYNDMGGGGHNSDTIPAILAVAEREKSGGRDFLTALIISYELGARFSDAPGGHTSYDSKGYTIDIRGGVTLPPAIGKLMGLNEAQIANAIGICASHSLPLGILDTNREENFHAKNLRVGFVARDAIESCLLAKNGFTGPVRVVEGENGIQKVIMKGEMDLEIMTDFSGWRIPSVRFKSLCCNGTSMGHISATLDIVKENNLHPEDIAEVRIGTGLRESRHTASLSKKFPRNGETADHSAFYANAIAIKERHFGPKSMEPGKFTDPVVLELIDKISVRPHPDLSEHSSAGISEIITRDGRRFIKRVDIPHGFGPDPLTDKELEEKFLEMAVEHFLSEHIRKIFNIIWNIDQLDDIRDLTKLMVINNK